MPPARRARYAAYVQVGAPLGVLLAAAAGGFLVPHLGWRMVFTLSALPAVIVALGAWRWLPESDVWARRGVQSARTDFGALWTHRHILALLFVVILVNSEAYWFTYSWMPGYLQLKRGLTDQASGRLMIGMQLGAIVGYGVFGVLADHFGRRPVFSIFAALMAAGVLPPTLLWRWSAAFSGLIPGAMVVAGIGTGLWSGVPPVVSELLPTRVRNSALGLLLNVTRGLQFFTPILVATIGARAGFGPTLAVGSLFSAVGAILIWVLPETRGRSILALDN
jgi:predicted MFS family arabinose efflux permease